MDSRTLVLETRILNSQITFIVENLHQACTAFAEREVMALITKFGAYMSYLIMSEQATHEC